MLTWTTKTAGPAKLKALEAVHGALQTPVVAITGSGGSHYVYVAQEGIRPPGKLGNMKGLDLKYNGCIVLAPLPHCAGKPPVATGKNYAWEEGKDPFDNELFIPMMPDWLLIRGPSESKSLAAPRGAVDSGDVFASDTQKAGLSLEQIDAYLELLQNDGSIEEVDDYDTWLGVLAGL